MDNLKVTSVKSLVSLVFHNVRKLITILPIALYIKRSSPVDGVRISVSHWRCQSTARAGEWATETIRWATEPEGRAPGHVVFNMDHCILYNMMGTLKTSVYLSKFGGMNITFQSVKLMRLLGSLLQKAETPTKITCLVRLWGWFLVES